VARLVSGPRAYVALEANNRQFLHEVCISLDVFTVLGLEHPYNLSIISHSKMDLIWIKGVKEFVLSLHNLSDKPALMLCSSPSQRLCIQEYWLKELVSMCAGVDECWFVKGRTCLLLVTTKLRFDSDTSSLYCLLALASSLPATLGYLSKIQVVQPNLRRDCCRVAALAIRGAKQALLILLFPFVVLAVAGVSLLPDTVQHLALDTCFEVSLCPLLKTGSTQSRNHLTVQTSRLQLDNCFALSITYL
jgi:hypothetical protein